MIKRSAVVLRFSSYFISFTEATALYARDTNPLDDEPARRANENAETSVVTRGASLTDGGWDFKVGTLTAFSFVVGGVTSMISGYIGMMIAVFTNARCTMSAASTPDAVAWRESFNSAFRGGAVMGFALSGGVLSVTRPRPFYRQAQEEQEEEQEQVFFFELSGFFF